MSEINIDHRLKFQIERIILFTDAVFAIAITLLVIEIKVPEFHNGETNKEVLSHLAHMIPKFIGYIVSFILIGVYWMFHHRLFGFLVRYDVKLIWLNLFFLMFIALMPFSSGFYSENFGRNTAFMLYALNLTAIGLLGYWLLRYIGNPRNGLSRGLEDSRLRRFYEARSLTVIGIYLLGFALCLLNNTAASWIARFIFILIWPALVLLRRLYHPRHPDTRREVGPEPVQG